MHAHIALCCEMLNSAVRVQSGRPEPPEGLLLWTVPTALLQGKGGSRQRVNSPSLVSEGRRYQACLIFPDDGACVHHR